MMRVKRGLKGDLFSAGAGDYSRLLKDKISLFARLYMALLVKLSTAYTVLIVGFSIQSL